MAIRRKMNRWLQLAGLMAAVAMLVTSGFSLAGSIRPYPGADDPDGDDLKDEPPPKGGRLRGTANSCKTECSNQLATCAMACGGAKELKEDDEEKLKKDSKSKKAPSQKQSTQDKCHEKCATQQQKCLSACK